MIIKLFHLKNKLILSWGKQNDATQKEKTSSKHDRRKKILLYDK